jgi:hypothetical protein
LAGPARHREDASLHALYSESACFMGPSISFKCTNIRGLLVSAILFENVETVRRFICRMHARDLAEKRNCASGLPRPTSWVEGHYGLLSAFFGRFPYITMRCISLAPALCQHAPPTLFHRSVVEQRHCTSLCRSCRLLPLPNKAIILAFLPQPAFRALLCIPLESCA